LDNIPKVTVIIPTHNHAHFLPECLASVRMQSYKDYEVIVIDNGSTDNTKDIIRQLSWDKLKYHYQDDTGSVAGPRNTGIRLANGEYVAFLDSDDLWYEKKLEKIIGFLFSNPWVDIISHDLFLTRQGKEKKLLKCGPLKKDMFKFLLIRNPLLGSATVVKRNLMLEVGGFNESKDYVHAEDSEVWLRIAYLKKNFYFFNEPLGEYRVHSSNLSHDFERVLLNEKNVIHKHFKKLNSKIPFHGYFLYINRLSKIHANLGIQCFFRKRYAESLYNISKSFFLNPVCLLSRLLSVLLKFPV